jgi:hypothetical protein
MPVNEHAPVLSIVIGARDSEAASSKTARQRKRQSGGETD